MTYIIQVDLRNSIPNQQAHATGGASEAVTKLKELMNDVQQIKVEREKIEKVRILIHLLLEYLGKSITQRIEKFRIFSISAK